MRADERRIRLTAGGVAVGAGGVAAAAQRAALEADERCVALADVEVVGRRLAQLEREAGDLRAAEGAGAGRGTPDAVSGAACRDDPGACGSTRARERDARIQLPCRPTASATAGDELIHEAADAIAAMSLSAGPSTADDFILTAAAGNCHTLLLSAKGVAYGFGYGGGGRLGLGSAVDDRRVLTPRMIHEGVAAVTLRAVAAGTYHSLLLAADGVVYTCGEGGLGQLGHGEACAKELSPRPVASLRDVGVSVSAVAAGRLHSLCVTEDGECYSWGEGDDGRLGHGAACLPVPVPRLIATLRGHRVCAVACVWDHSIAITDAGTVYSWGLGLAGQLGHGAAEEEETVTAPRKIEALHATKVAAVAAGPRTCFAVANTGRLYGWGFGRTTEEEKSSTLGMRLEGNQCIPKLYAGLRVSRPHLVRTSRAAGGGPTGLHADAPMVSPPSPHLDA